jgi:hypothetical protein
MNTVPGWEPIGYIVSDPTEEIAPDDEYIPEYSEWEEYARYEIVNQLKTNDRVVNHRRS